MIAPTVMTGFAFGLIMPGGATPFLFESKKRVAPPVVLVIPRGTTKILPLTALPWSVVDPCLLDYHAMLGSTPPIEAGYAVT
jgi:hypothetical protein